MNRLLFVACSLALAGFAVPAAATIIISTDGVKTDENVQFNDAFDYTDVNPLFTLTNKGNGVTFIGTENMDGAAGGQARIEASDGGLDYLEYSLFDPLFGFKATEFNIVVGKGDASSVDITMYDQFGGVYTLLGASLGKGENRFSGLGLDDQFIVRVVMSMNGDVEDIRQVRLDGSGFIPTPSVVVPEPAAWAMFIAGFGLVGGAMRRRNTSLTRVSA